MELFDALTAMPTVLCICPCCGEIARVSDCRPSIPARQPPSIVDRLATQETRLEQQEAKLAEQELVIRQKSRLIGYRRAFQRLKRLSNVLADVDLHADEAEAVFDPIEYIVWNTDRRGQKIREVVLIGRVPEDQAAETKLRSIERTVAAGNYEFVTLRLDEAGAITCERASSASA